MKRFLTSSRAKAGLALLGGGALIAGGWCYLQGQPDDRSYQSNVVKTFFRKHFLTADSFTHSVLDTRFQRTPIPWDQNWDKRDPETLVRPLGFDATDEEKELRSERILQHSARAKRIIILVRHGQYNDKGQDDSERYLTDLGREQADLTGKRLAKMFRHYQSKMGFDENENQLKLDLSIVHSTMSRATETAQIILKHFPGTASSTCDMIREGAPCEPVPAISPLLWNPSPMAFYEDGARIEAAFRKYIHRAEVDQKNDSVEIIVCHANVIRYFVCRALQLPPEAWLRFSLHNGSFTVMSIQPNGRVSVSILGEAGHFPVEKMTFN